jgi:hypothetical protein
VTYVHLLLDRHEIVYANGIASESFYPGPWGLRTLGTAALRGILAAVPQLQHSTVEVAYGPTVVPFSRFQDLPKRVDQLTGVGGDCAADSI